MPSESSNIKGCHHIIGVQTSDAWQLWLPIGVVGLSAVFSSVPEKPLRLWFAHNVFVSSIYCCIPAGMSLHERVLTVKAHRSQLKKIFIMEHCSFLSTVGKDLTRTTSCPRKEVQRAGSVVGDC